MSKTIAKGRLFSVTTEVNDDRLRAMRDAPELAEKALIAGADYWHTGILPKHFEKSAHSVYDYADRSKAHNKRKQGRPDLVFSGSLRRDLKAKASFQRVGQGVNLKMTARVLNFVPRMAENSLDRYVKHKKGRGYPNLKREIKAQTPQDREDVASVVTSTLESLFAPGEKPSKVEGMAPTQPTTA